MKRLPILLFLAACATPAADDVAPATGTGPSAAPLEEAIALPALLGHLQALQAAADAHGDTRAVGTPGFDASADYAEQVLTEAGYAVVREPFSFSDWVENGPAALSVPADPGMGFTEGSDFAAMSYSPGGSVQAELAAVDLILPPDSSPSSTSGCEASDFDGFIAGQVALIQRGTCLFQDKALNAQDAGASAVILFNEGQSGRTDLEPWQLSSDGGVTIPVVAASFEVGDALAGALGAGPVVVDLTVDAQVRMQESINLIAETADGSPDRVLVVGGHLDSVPAGPGINDNGTGVALVLELARLTALRPDAPKNRIRFALWGAEEIGLLGSTAHVEGLGADADRVFANLNFDMVGSPNGSAMVYDGDGDDFGLPGPEGSDTIEASFRDFFDRDGLPVAATMFDGRSDYFGFIRNGIPAGGLFSGAEGLKASDEADLFGGQAGAPRDPCYHRDCDTIDNLDHDLFLQLSRAGAHTTWDLANRASLDAPVASKVHHLDLDPVGLGCQHDVATR